MTTLGQFILRANDRYKLSKWEITKLYLSGAMSMSTDADVCANCDHYALNRDCAYSKKKKSLPFETCFNFECIMRRK